MKLIEYLELIIKLDYDWTNEPDEMTIYGQSRSDHAAYQFPQYDGIDNAIGKEIIMDTTDPDDIWLNQFLYDDKSITVAMQTHHHSATCRKKGTVCRFGFTGDGKALSSHTS